MSILSQVTHNLKCPQDIPSLLIFSSQFMVHSQLQYPQVIAIPLDFLVSIHGQLASPNIRKILPSLLIFWSQFMVHLQPSGSPRPLFPLSTGHFLYSPANFVFSSSASTLSSFSLFLSLGLSRPSYSLHPPIHSSPHTDSSK